MYHRYVLSVKLSVLFIYFFLLLIFIFISFVPLPYDSFPSSFTIF